MLARLSTTAEEARSLFIAEIKKFKQKHQKTLKEIFSSTEILPYGVNTRSLVTEFFENAVIQKYLRRDGSQLSFAEDKPLLINASKKDEKVTTDYYELRIYKLLNKNFLLFRDKIDSSKFYTEGMETLTHADFINNLIERHNSDDLHAVFNRPGDVYSIRGLLDDYSAQDRESLTSDLLDKRFRFILTPNRKDDHFTFMLHIADQETRRILASVFINSWDSSFYFTYISEGFNRSHQKMIPLIDASHSLQREKDDGNCGFYSLNNLRAVSEMLAQPAVANRIYELAKAIDKGSAEATTELCRIFKIDLKFFLPCYYNQKGESHPYTQIKKYHLEQRWNIDGQLLAQTFPAKENPVSSVSSVITPRDTNTVPSVYSSVMQNNNQVTTNMDSSNETIDNNLEEKYSTSNTPRFR